MTTPIFYAAPHGYSEVVQALVEAGAKANVCDSQFNTPLDHAVVGRHVDTIEVLLSVEGVLVKEGVSALLYSVAINHEGMVGILLEKGVSANSRITFEEDHLFITVGHRDNQLLAMVFGMKIVSKPGFYITILHFAAAVGGVDAAKLLLDAGADIKALDYRGLTPLFYSIWYNRKQVAQLLLEAGCDVNRAFFERKTVLDYSISLKHSEITSLLREHGAKTGEELAQEKQSVTIQQE